jgi:hypothetical protein
MTTPQQPPQQDPAADIAVAAAVAEIGTVLLTAVTVAAAAGALARMTQGMGIARQAMFSALGITMGHPPGQTGFYGPATMATERSNLQRRAMFVLAAARRITADLAAAHSRGQGMAAALAAAVTRERRFYAQHLIATWQRSQAGAQVDGEAMTRGLLLGWHTKHDSKTSAECRQADGRNFYADHMPLIGYPGAVHPHCRCRAGAPFPGARLLPSTGIPSTGRYRRAA